MTTKIIIDSNALAWKVKHSLKDLSFDERSVGVIFGFMNQILKIATDYETNDISFCWDSKNNNRYKLFPAYKEKRRTAKDERTPEEVEEDQLAYAQFEQLCDFVLPTLGVTNNYKIDGFEGDDLIASIVFNNENDDFIIATGDEDLYQLLGDGVSIRRTRKNRLGKNEYYLYTEAMFMEEYGILPEQWVHVKAIAGCKSDGVPGVVGVGEFSAIQYLLGKYTPNNKRYQSIGCLEGRAIRSRNKPLVELPFKGTPDIILNKQEGWSFDGFTKICEQFNFQSMLKKEVLTKWKQSLRLV